MAKKKNNKKQPWSSSLASRQALYDGINPASDFGIGSILTQTAGYLGGFRTGKGIAEDEARWAAYLGLPYDKEYAPDTNIRFEHDKNYPDRQYQGISKRAKNEIRKVVIPKAKEIKDKYNKEWIQVLDENSIFGNDSTIYHPRETYTGDLGKFGIREVGNSGIYEVGDKYDFPSWIAVPDRNEGTELMVRDTIWSDRANPKLYKQELIKRKNNKFFIGGLVNSLADKNNSATDKFMGSSLGQGLGKLGVTKGNIGGIANTAATAIGGLLAGKNKTGVGTAMQKMGSLASNIPGVGGLIGAGVNLAGGIVNAAFGSNLNEEKIAEVEGNINKLASFNSNAGDYDALAANYANSPVMANFSKKDIGTDGWFSNKAGEVFADLQEKKAKAEDWVTRSLSNNADNIASNTQQLLEANYTAHGGPLFMRNTGVMSPFGNRFGMGGFTNNVTTIGNGGTHESNPFEGVQMGVDPQGIPNLVEEGEVIFNDYVFSNRLKVPKAVRQKYRLRGVTFADAAEQLQKESKERPNDPISKNGLEASMNRLMQEQEMVRVKNESNKYAHGGKLGNLFDGEGGDPNWLYKPVTPDKFPSKEDVLAGLESNYSFLTKGPEFTQEDRKMLGKDLTSFINNTQAIDPIKYSPLRYAPIVGAGINVLNDLFRDTDYGNADLIFGSNVSPAFVRQTPVGQKLAYRPFDRDFYINKLNANTAAGRRAVANTSGGNRAAALAGILSSDYNYGNQLGDLARQAEEYNLAQRQKVADFNRATDMFNAQQSLQAQTTNANNIMQARQLGLSKNTAYAKMRQDILDQDNAVRANNWTNLLEGIADLGKENTAFDAIRYLTDKGVLRGNAYGGRIKRKKGITV